MSDLYRLLRQEDETAILDFLELERSAGRLKDDDVVIVSIGF